MKLSRNIALISKQSDLIMKMTTIQNLTIIGSTSKKLEINMYMKN